LIGARFLDAQSVDHILKNVVLERHFDINLKSDAKIVADCAYNTGENLRFLEDNKIFGLIPTISQTKIFSGRESTVKEDDYEYDEVKDEIIVNGIRLKFHALWKHRDDKKQRVYKSEDEKVIKRVPEFFKERLRMKKKMETEEGRNIYNLRKIVVEPVIGNIKYNLGFSEFSVRGLNGARLELNIASIAHNLKKIWIMRGKICVNNKILFYEGIIKNSFLIVRQPV
jgi:hypothetical protein